MAGAVCWRLPSNGADSGVSVRNRSLRFGRCTREPRKRIHSARPPIVMSRSVITTAASACPATYARSFGLAFLVVAIVGCNQADPIVQYSIPTEIPAVLRPGKERMLAAMMPKGDEVWFYKVTGPEEAIGSVESEFRDHLQQLEFGDRGPKLDELPEGWKLGGEKAMRFATIHVPTPDKQLEISVSQLSRQEDWDEQVKMNVNRWRGQLGLDASEDKWADGIGFEVAGADAEAVWVDLVGDPSSGSGMTPPFAGGRTPSGSVGATPGGGASAPKADPRVKYERPEGWRDGKMSSMRMAAFNAGPEDSSAELTVIPAGGDLRGNVARWLGQVYEEQVPDEIVDKALAEAKSVDVAGRSGQRFFLVGEDTDSGKAIDATIVPMDGGMSLFVKMTGPAKTVSEQSEAITSFLESLELNL